MNKKQKPKKKKAVATKTEIKRPAHKKPRPKKHVEAKIPQLPPVPTQTVEAKEATICTKHPGATKEPCLDCIKEKPKTVKIRVELPPGQTEESLTSIIRTATEQLKAMADKAQEDTPKANSGRVAERYAQVPEGEDKKRGGLGRYLETVEFSEDPVEKEKQWMELRQKYADMLNEEAPPKEGGWGPYTVIQEGWRKGRLTRAYPSHTSYVPPKPKSWFSRLISKLGF